MKTTGKTDNHITTSKIDPQRYRVVRAFFIRSFLHLLFWDIFLNRPILRWLRKSPVERWRKISGNYRNLAIEMGGVLIKLGQFLAVRVDILPREVTSELTGLLDEIPAVENSAIIQQIEEDFNRPISEIFEWFSPAPIGSASLGQVHPARLAKDHTHVVVKVLRPGIARVVETDLAAISQAISWLKRYKRVSKRVDLDWLIEEFSRVTRAELDFSAEGKNAERFANDFADDRQVHFPRIYWEYSADHTLTMENVGYIKVADHQGISSTGINQVDVSKKIYNIYLRQIFETHFIHADPHPGNIFVRPLPTEKERQQGLTDIFPGDAVVYEENRPFQIVFVDFGMVTEIPSRLRLALKEYVIGVATRDAYRIVQSYVQAETLLPGADLKRLEEAHQALLNRFWGANAQQMKDAVFTEGDSFIQEYRDVIYNAPFQFQADMLFSIRAVGILSGIATDLNEKFDPWQEIIPFAERIASKELNLNWQEWVKEIATIGQIIYKLPKSVDTIMSQAKQGNLTFKNSFTSESRILLVRIERSINTLSWTIASLGLLIAGIYSRENFADNKLWIVLMVSAALFFGWGIWKNRRR